MARVLLINPSYQGCYAGVKASIVDPIFPTLALATTAAAAEQRGHRVEILDLSHRPYDPEEIRARLRARSPDIVGITATTPLMNQLRDISLMVKDLSGSIRVVGGGPHPSALPRETLLESHLDAVVVGEGDVSFGELCDGAELRDIAGLVLRDGDATRATPSRAPIDDLDTLPIPAWHLYPLDSYRQHFSRLFARRVPMVTAEFSRGCVFSCDFCSSKVTLSGRHRKKSPERCAEEVRRMQRLGIREFQLADDVFTLDRRWAAQVADAIAATGVDMPWTCTNGIRVESADEGLFRALRRAGCYRVAFGLESGSDEVLRAFGKGGRASVEQAVRAVRAAREAGVESFGFFMLGLSADTERTMQETIDFARALPVDMLKFSRCVAFPGSAMFRDYRSRGLIRSFNWDDYHIYSADRLFDHPGLDEEVIVRYMSRAYRQAILFNPGFVFRRLVRGLRTGELLWDAYYLFRFALMRETDHTPRARYYAPERWRRHDFTSSDRSPS
jgi:anaerobic magnesium-protoporphyrin IX monomethyl ester cyclase